MHAHSFQADDGETLHVWRHGEQGPALVFLHGWTASHLEWSPFVHDLAKHFRIYRWDARGHGGHNLTTNTPVTVARMAADLEQMVQAFDLEDACFIGHSMGALTLWQYQQDFGSRRLGKLCFIDQSPKLVTDAGWPWGIYGDFDAQRAAQFAQDLAQDFAEGVLRLTAHGLNEAARRGYDANSKGWQKARDSLQIQNPAPLIQCWNSLTAADYRPVIPKIDRPSLLIYGEKSNFYHLDTAHWLMARLPQGQLVTYPDTNHSPHLCDPQRFLADLTRFAGAVTTTS